MRWRRYHPSAEDADVHIDMAPMIDCVFLLLIFFIVTSVFVADPGIDVQKPDVSGEPSTDRNTLLLAITSDERVYFDGEEIAPGHIAAALGQVAFGETIVVIRADQAASHGIFARVYAEARKSGVKQIRFATAR